MAGSTKTEHEEKILQEAMSNGISSRKELANLLAQVAHESGNFNTMEENLNYSAKRLAQVWPNRYADKNHNPNSKALNIERNPEKIANDVYANRMGNGNSDSGDGYRYRGRGYIQLTGKSNYEMASKELQIDLVNKPDLAATPEIAAKVAVLYWETRVPDSHKENVQQATKDINGGLNGLKDRQEKYNEYYEKLTPEYLDKIQRGMQHSSNTQYDDFSALVNNLINDKDGSFTKQLLADNKDVVDAFDAKVQERIQQEQQKEQLQIAEQEMQKVVERSGRRLSFG